VQHLFTEDNAMSTPYNIHLITTGGTIAGQVAADKQDQSMKRRAEEFAQIVAPAIAYLNHKHNLDINLVPFELTDVDSSDIKPEHWISLVNHIKQEYDNYDAFIITHGTNTMGYTCAALSFALSNPNKPILLTGSQVSAGLPGSDGLTNLENTLRLAAWPREATPSRG
jgi:L-asparaginase